MNREFENGFDQEEKNIRGRSRRQGGSAPAFSHSSREGARRRTGSEEGESARLTERSRSLERRPSGERIAGERPRFTGDQPAEGRRTESYRSESRGSENHRSESRRRGEGTRDSAFRRGGEGGYTGRRTDREGSGSGFPKKTGRRGLIITLIILEIFFLVFTGAYRYAINKMNQMQVSSYKPAQVTNPNITNQKMEEMSGYWTVALFGVDSRTNAVGKGNNADVIIICNIDQGTGAIKLVSVFRDTYLNISDQGLYNKINQAYFRGGPEQAVEALNRNLDLQIDDFATFNWKAVVDAVNILGGVDVELSKAEFYYINSYITETVKATGVYSTHLKSAGMNHLDGVQAVAYARLRKMDTDYARTERQREIIEKCFQKLKKSDFAVVNNVMEVVFPQILSSVTIDDIIPAAKNLTKYTIADTMGFPSARTDGNMGKKGACVIPQTLESNVTLLHQFLFGDENYQPSDMVKKISAKISADTGMYKEAKPIDHVGTDGGYIPKETQAPKATESTEELESETNESETDESIIDGETDLEIETDEFGNEIDPPEDEFLYPGESSAGGTDHGRLPGETLENDHNTGPGADTSDRETTSAYPGSQNSGNTSSTHPGNQNGGNTSSTYPGSQNGGNTSNVYPGNQNSGNTSSTYPGSQNGGNTSNIYPGSQSGGNNSSSGSSEEYVPDGPGAVILGPGSQ